MLRLMYNGIKKDGKLIKGHWSISDEINMTGKITFYARGYENTGLGKYFNVINNSEIIEDYFEKDHFTIEENSQFYKAAKIAVCKQQLRRIPKYIEYANKNKKLYGYRGQSTINFYEKDIKNWELAQSNCKKVLNIT